MGTPPGLSCPDEGRWTLYLDGEIADAERRELTAHLESCARCAHDVQVLQTLEGALRPDTDERPSPELLGRLQSIPDRRRPIPRVLPVSAAAAAALLLAAALVWPARVEPPVTRPTEPLTLRDQVRIALVRPGPGSEELLEGLGDSALIILHRIAVEEDAAAARAALGRLGSRSRRESLPILIEAVGMPDRRRAAVEALAALGDERGLRALEPLVAEGELDDVVLPAVARIGGDRAAGILARRIVTAIGEPEAPALVRLLAEADGAAGVRELLRLLMEPELAEPAFAALHERSEEVLPHLLEEAAGPNDVLASFAIKALEHIRAPESVRVLGDLLPDPHRRIPAADALVAIDTVAAAAALFRHARVPEVRSAFRRAGPGIESWLVAQLVREDVVRRRLAIGLLAHCGTHRSVETLASLATERGLSSSVLSTLRQIGGEEAVRVLVGLAKSRRLRREVVETLGLMPEESAVRALIHLGAEERRHAARNRTLRVIESMDPELVAPVLAQMSDGELGPGTQNVLDLLTAAPARPTTRWSVLE